MVFGSMKYMFLLLGILAGECCYLYMSKGSIINKSNFNEALSRHDSGPARVRLAWIHKNMLQELSGESLKSYLYLASFYDLYGYQAEASAVYDILQQVDPGNYEAFYKRGLVLVKLGRHGHAVQDFKKALEFASDVKGRSVCNYHLGLLSLRSEDKDSAIYYFEKAYGEIDHWPAYYERLALAVYVKDRIFFDKHISALEERFKRTTEFYHLMLKAEETFEDVRYAQDRHDVDRRSVLYQEFDAEAESRMRANLGLNLNQINESDLFVNILLQAVAEQSSNRDLSQRGEELFRESRCTLCHGFDARGLSGPNLRDDYWIHGSSPTQLYRSISEGGQHMPAMKYKLSTDQIATLIAYIYLINKETVKNSDGSAKGKPAQGDLSPQINLRVR